MHDNAEKLAGGGPAGQVWHVRTAAVKAESGKDASTDDKDEGPDVSAGKYGVQEMNQSRNKPNIVITHIGDLGVKLNEKTVNIRGRLHASRAKGWKAACSEELREGLAIISV